MTKHSQVCSAAQYSIAVQYSTVIWGSGGSLAGVAACVQLDAPLTQVVLHLPPTLLVKPAGGMVGGGDMQDCRWYGGN